jgi:hypothetical protein
MTTSSKQGKGSTSFSEEKEAKRLLFNLGQGRQEMPAQK